MTLEEYEDRIDQLERQGDREAACSLSDLSREVRLIAWSYHAMPNAKGLADRADRLAWEIAGLARQPRWDARPATGSPAVM